MRYIYANIFIERSHRQTNLLQMKSKITAQNFRQWTFFFFKNYVCITQDLGEIKKKKQTMRHTRRTHTDLIAERTKLNEEEEPK